ncbi:MAG: PepSY-like domain-containing protein [Bacteroidota bacterium]
MMKKLMVRLWVLGMAVFAVACNPIENLWEDVSNLGSIESITEAELPADVLTTLQAEYGDQTIADLAKIIGSDGSEVFGITFQDGKTVSLKQDGGLCPSISVDSLLESITAYISTTYPDEAILHAVSMEKEGETVYHVRISSGEILSFDSTGEFLEAREGKGRKKGRGKRCGTEVEVAELPASAQTYLTDQYPDAEVLKVIQLDRRDDTTVYLVKLDNQELLFFDVDGNVLEDFRPGWGS